MSLRKPRVTYDPGVVTVLDFAYPQGLWTPSGEGEGASDKSASGLRVSYERRSETFVAVRLRFHESQWLDVRAWLRFAQRSGRSFTYDFDRDVPGAPYAFTVDLEEPKMGDRVEPRRIDEFPEAFEIDATLRAIGAATLHVPVYG